VKRLRLACAAFCFLLGAVSVSAQTIRSMDFRNRPIVDILMALADSAGASIITDETVSGTATFHFSDSQFSEALKNFLEACRLHAVEKDGVWYVSRILVSGSVDAVSINAEDANIGQLLRSIARNLSVTVLYDELPNTTVTIFTEGQKLQEVLEIVVKRYPEFSVLYENGAYYVKKESDSRQTSGTARISSSSIKKTGELYSMQIPRGNFSAVAALLFRTAGIEYSMMQRNETTLENLFFTGKTFEELLHLICEQGNSDFTVNNGVYYVFEIQRRDVLKKLRDTVVIQLRNISVAECMALLPAEYAGSFIKQSPATNSMYLTGSGEEIDSIAAFIEFADAEAAQYTNREYKLRYIRVDAFIKLLPKLLAEADIKTFPETNSFLARVDENLDREFTSFIGMADRSGSGIPVKLRYITSEELLKSLPPSAVKEDIVTTLDPSLVFYTGTAEQKKKFDEDLLLLDRMKPQIRYQILVIQYQKSNNINWDPNITVNPEEGSDIISGSFSNILNMNFDVISAFGHRFAGNLNMQLGEDKARLLADTTLNGLSGQEIKFENTNTFRYLDVALDPETGKPLYTGTTREINSGLVLTLNGWVSGDGMITMRVDAAVSKQDEAGASSTNPPPTSARSVNTQVRTRSGTPIIIGGLLQLEKTESKSRVPILGYIPLLGLLFQKRVMSDTTSEMVIYIIPHVHNGAYRNDDYDRQNEEYLRKYGGGI
jgi:type II secretory pathway component GspD/PulD (secretin)